MFETTVVRLAVQFEQLGQCQAAGLDDPLVHLDKGPAQRSCDEGAQGALARTAQPDQGHDTHGVGRRSDQPIRGRLERRGQGLQAPYRNVAVSRVDAGQEAFGESGSSGELAPRPGMVVAQPPHPSGQKPEQVVR